MTKEQREQFKKMILGELRQDSDRWGNGYNSAIRAISDRLDKLLDGAVTVQGQIYEDGAMVFANEGDNPLDTHTAILLNITPVEQAPSVEEILQFLRAPEDHPLGGDSCKLADLIERHGIRGSK